MIIRSIYLPLVVSFSTVPYDSELKNQVDNGKWEVYPFKLLPLVFPPASVNMLSFNVQVLVSRFKLASKCSDDNRSNNYANSSNFINQVEPHDHRKLSQSTVGAWCRVSKNHLHRFQYPQSQGNVDCDAMHLFYKPDEAPCQQNLSQSSVGTWSGVSKNHLKCWPGAAAYQVRITLLLL